MRNHHDKKRGFTIIEVIGILVVLGILLAIAVPTIGNVISNSYMKAYEINLESMEDGARSYILKNNIKIEPGENRQIQISELVEESLIRTIVDPQTKEVCVGYVTAINYADSYRFSSCLNCGEKYISDDCNKTDFGLPLITLVGDDLFSLYVGETYRDAGAIAFDEIEGYITDRITVTGYINPDKAGTYTLTYNVSDSQGNEALPVTRTINVIDNVKPIISFNPIGNTTYAQSRSATVKVRDANSGVKSNSLKYLWNASLAEPSKDSFNNSFTNGGTINSTSGVTGSYYLWVYAEDNVGNYRISRSNIFNLDNTPPISPTITISPTAPTSGNVTVSVTYPSDADIKKVSTNNGTTWSDYTGTLVVTSNTTVLAYATDSSGNQSSNAKHTISNIDKTNPTIATTLRSSQRSNFSTWTLGGGAYINGSGALVLPTTGSSIATSPYMPSIATPWELQANGITSSASPYYTPKGGLLMGSNYYDSSYQSTVASNGYSGNGRAQELSLNTMTPFSWQGGNGENVYYVRINIRSDGNYGVSPITVSDFKFITDGKSNYGKIIYATSSDVSGIRVTKWLAGAKTVNDFTSTGNTFTSSFEVTSNGTYTIYAEDNVGNKATKQVVVSDIDTSYPTVSFGTNGNTTYAQSRTTTVTVSDNVGINTNGLKYVWNTSTTEPSPSSFTTTFINGGTINSPSDATGSYYLWISAQDTAGNTTITRSNVFNLDNTKPVITRTGNATVTVNKGASYTDAGATATDAHSGLNGSIVTTSNVNTSKVGTYTVTYNISDKAGNAATPVTRTVNVIDVQAPVITILGSNPVSADVGVAYTDAGATATDDVDGNVTSRITTTSTVNTSQGGVYTVTYTVKDNAGNTATATRTVNMYATWYRYRSISSATYYGNYSASSSTSYYCPSGYTSSGSGSSMTCSKTETATRLSNTTYSCPSGYTSSGSGSSTTCRRTVSASSSSANVSCPSGWTMSSANNCYQNVSGPTTTYSCSSGTLVNTNQCRTTSTTTPTCSAGYFVSGTGCKDLTPYSSDSSCRTACGVTCQSTAGSAPWYCSSKYRILTPSCSSGYTLNSTTTACYKYNYTSATSSKSCPSGSTYVSSVDKCRIYNSSRVYSCSSGTLSGTTCYSCSSGTLSGTSCIQTTSPNTSTTYSCPSGYTSSGSGSSMTCSKTVYTSNQSSTSYSCPSGGSLSGTTCYRGYYSCSSGTLSGSSCYGSWSAWSTTKATASSTREVQTEKRLTSN